MKMLLLGAGKTGSLVAEVARERGHVVTVLRSAENANGSGLTPELLTPIDVVIDFTTPDCVLANIRACVAAKKNMVHVPMIGSTIPHDVLHRQNAAEILLKPPLTAVVEVR